MSPALCPLGATSQPWGDGAFRARGLNLSSPGVFSDGRRLQWGLRGKKEEEAEEEEQKRGGAPPSPSPPGLPASHNKNMCGRPFLSVGVGGPV